MVAICNATLKIPGTTYTQASDNCYSFMKIHGVPVESMDALFNRTVIDIYENKKATYSKYGLYYLKRRKPWEGMADFSKLTSVSSESLIYILSCVHILQGSRKRNIGMNERDCLNSSVTPTSFYDSILQPSCILLEQMNSYDLMTLS